MQAVDLAIQNGVDLDGTPIPQKMLDLYNRIMDEENKRQRSGVRKSMRNRCVKTGSKHFDQETLNLLLIDSGWEGLKEKEILFRSNFLNYLNHPFLLEDIIFSFSAFVLLIAFLKAKLASITVTIDIKKRPEIPIICSFGEGSESPCKKMPKANRAVLAVMEKK